MKNIGLHIRLIDKISNVAKKACRLNIPYFQTFLIDSSKQFTKLTTQDVEQFLYFRPQFKTLFLHASYWINCASPYKIADKLLEREFYLAELLQFDYLVIHPGSIAHYQTKSESIKLIAQRINRILNKFEKVNILLENVGHAKRSLGGKFKELRSIYDFIEQQHRVSFCVDTAHAHVYGYNLLEPQEFIEILNQELELQKIKLIHLNDTQKEMGSHIDIHTCPGKGKIGKQNLCSILHHPQLEHSLTIIELPKIDEEKERTVIEELKKW